MFGKILIGTGTDSLTKVIKQESKLIPLYTVKGTYSTIMNTAGTILFSIKLLKLLYKGFNNVTKENGKDNVLLKEKLEPVKTRHAAVHWPSCVGLGMVLIGGSLLIFGKKKLTDN
jgi:uncharacterized protein YhfF